MQTNQAGFCGLIKLCPFVALCLQAYATRYMSLNYFLEFAALQNSFSFLSFLQPKYLTISVDTFLTSLLELVVISCWFGIWTLEDRICSSVFGYRTGRYGALASLVAIQFTNLNFYEGLTIHNYLQILGFLTATLVFSLQFVWLYAIENTASKLRRWVLNFSGNQVLSAIGLVSTVSNLRAVWYLLDIYILPSKQTGKPRRKILH